MERPSNPSPHGHVHDPAGPFHYITCVQILIGAEQDDPDFIPVRLEGNAEHTTGKIYQLLEAHARETGGLRNASGDADYSGHLAQRQVRRSFKANVWR